MKIAIYPGTFDPITNGHIDIIKRSSQLFHSVIVAVALNVQKTPLFSTGERVKLIRDAISELDNITVDNFEGLLVDYAKEKNAIAVIRGLRAVTDFEYEFQMALMNRRLDEKLITVFLMPHEKYTYLDSSIIKEIAFHGREVSHFVPSNVCKALKEKIKKKSEDY